MGRGFALLLSALLLLASGCDEHRSAAPGGGDTAPSSTRPDASRGFAPPAGQRWAGLNRVVVAVPAGWRSIGTPFCQTPPTHTVVYYDPMNIANGCPFQGFIQRRDPSYLAVGPAGRVTRQDLAGTHEVDLGGARAYAWNHPQGKYGQSAGILVPSQHVEFSIRTPDATLAGRIIRSARMVPHGFQVIPKPAYASRRLDDMMQRLRHHGLRPTYAEEGPGNTEYGYPGRFIRTDPPVGSVVRHGEQVTAYFSSGRLTAWISLRRLDGQGWSLALPRSFTPPVTRTEALARLGRAPNERAAFLRTLTIDGRTRQAWLVVVRPHYAYRGQAVTLSAVDARTGHLWRADVSFPATR